ncbi:MAG: hypothetical protein F4Y82_00310 [Cenarchaeum sp. SB0665_bin_23]|nr:hypothetical protein [Cenarchaeum sp. SB0665_bin_23]
MNLFSFLSNWHIILGISSGSAAYHLIGLVSILAQMTRDGSTHGFLAFFGSGPAFLLVCITPVLLFVSIRAIRQEGKVRVKPILAAACIGTACVMGIEFGPPIFVFLLFDYIW